MLRLKFIVKNTKYCLEHAEYCNRQSKLPFNFTNVVYLQHDNVINENENDMEMNNATNCTILRLPRKTSQKRSLLIEDRKNISEAGSSSGFQSNKKHLEQNRYLVKALTNCSKVKANL